LLAILELSFMVHKLNLGKDSYKTVYKTIKKVYSKHLDDSYIMTEFT